MRYRLIDKCFIVVWAIVMVVGIQQLNTKAKNVWFPEIRFSHHVVGITSPMLKSLTSKGQLAAILAHEISHIQLGHTLKNNHHIKMEYNADIMSVYYLKKAGFGLCGSREYWENSKDSYLDISPTSHPNYLTRAYYMSMPECKQPNKRTAVQHNKRITVQDVVEVFNKLQRHVAGKARYTTILVIDKDTEIKNAYATTIFEKVIK